MPQAQATTPIRAGFNHWTNVGASGPSDTTSQPCPLPAEGDRIRLIEMPNDPCPMLPGSEGTVSGVVLAADQIHVEWDCGSRLNLIIGQDAWSVVEKAQG